MLNGCTVLEAAKQTGASRRTIHRWLNDDEFSNELKKARKDVSESALRKIVSDVSLARKTLVDVMENKKASPASRVQAARTVYEYAHPSIEKADILERIAKLEEVTDE